MAIEDRSHDEVAVVRQERWLRSLAETITEIVWTTRPDGFCDYQNARWLAFSGMTAEESRGSGWMNSVDPLERGTIEGAWAESVRTGTPFEHQIRLRRADRVFRRFHMRAEPLRDDRGEVVRWFATCTDVDGCDDASNQVLSDHATNLDNISICTERDVSGQPTTANSLEETQHFTDRIASIFPVILYIYELVGDRALYRNRDLAVILGYTADHYPVMDAVAIAALMHPEDHVRLAAHISTARTLRDGECAGFEFRMRRADSEWHWFYTQDSVFARDGDGNATQLIGAAVDINDRKRAEEALRASEERFRLAAEVVRGVMYDFDCATGHVARSSGLYAITGFHPDEAEPSLEWWLERIHPDDRAGSEREFDAGAGAGPANREAEYRVRHRDGSYRHVWDCARTVNDDQGRVLRFVGCTIDLTANRMAQAAALENERRLRKLVDSDIIGVIFGDIHGGISYANDEFLRIVGYSRHEFESSHIGWATLSPPEWLAVAKRMIAEAKSGDGVCPPYEKEYLHKDGSRVPVLLGFTLFGDTESLAIALDLTERKRSEAALRESEERLSLAIESSRLGVWDWDLRGDHALWNRQHEIIFGYEPGKPWRSFDEFVARVPPEDLSVIQATFAKARETRTEFRLAHRVVWPDGTVRWIDAHGRFYYDATGQAVRSLGIVADITDLKRAEEVLRDADRRKDEFLAMLAHELRNPIAALASALEVAGLPDATARDLTWVREAAQRQVHTLVRLIDDLLDVSRISTGKIHLKKERLDGRVLIARAIEASRAFVEAKRHELIVSVDERPLALIGDATRLEQVLANLINNAAKYTDSQGQIWLSASAEGSEVVVTVRDTGVGITPALLPKIFDLFVQGDTSIDRSHGGLGIGLSLVKMLVEMHGGRVSATSDGPNQGSEFRVSLPLAADLLEVGKGPLSQPAAAITGTRRGRRILLVDDNADMLEGMAHLLTSAGHEVVKAADGASALLLAQDFRPEVVVLDIGMPGMTGLNVAEAMRRDGMLDTVIIAISGYAQDQDRQSSSRAGFDHHLSKPVELAALLAIIDQKP